MCVIPAKRLCHNYFFCHSVQAKRDTESSVSLVPGFHRDDVWIPAEVYPVPRYGAGVTVLKLLSTIVTQSRMRDFYKPSADMKQEECNAGI